MDSSPLASRLRGHESTIFSEMTALAVRHDAVNLGQGAPDWSGPDTLLEDAVAAIRDGRNQYAPGPGVPDLRRAIAEHAQRFHRLTYAPETEVVVTAGATEALTAAVLGLCDPGDEVIALAPSYDSYAAACAIAGVRLRRVLLCPEDGWALDGERLRAAITDRTRAVLINTPHNPTGRVLDDRDLRALADVCRGHDLVAITDEVYEHLWFDGHRHRSLATLPGMRDRTVVVSSAGKTFSVTGWKVGWACAPPPLRDAVLAAKQWLSFTNATPMQHAVAGALRLGDDWFAGHRADYTRRRDLLLGALRDHDLEVTSPQGTYFATLDVRQLGATDGLDLCRTLPAAAGVAAVPLQVFVDPDDAEDVAATRPWIRLAFCKRDDAMVEGARRLASYRDRRCATGG